MPTVHEERGLLELHGEGIPAQLLPPANAASFPSQQMLILGALPDQLLPYSSQSQTQPLLLWYTTFDNLG